jgi:hypothetical protein
MGHKSFGDMIMKSLKDEQKSLQRQSAKRKQMPKIPAMRHSVSVDKVGKSKLGHGGMCLQNHLTNKMGSKAGGQGLARV